MTDISDFIFPLSLQNTETRHFVLCRVETRGLGPRNDLLKTLFLTIFSCTNILCTSPASLSVLYVVGQFVIL